MNTDFLTQLQSEIKNAQYDAIVKEEPEYFKHIPSIKATVFKTGLFQTDMLVKNSAFDLALFNRCKYLAETDVSFDYINHIPAAGFLAAHRANALEESLYGRATDEVAHLAILMSAFTNLLDGILDETPDIFSKEQAKALRAIFLQQDWSEKIVLDPVVIQNAHPVVELLFAVTGLIIEKITRSPYWIPGSQVAGEFRMASNAAFQSELRSTKYLGLHEIPEQLDLAKTELSGKSSNWAWAVAMAPICMNGWPDGLTIADFRKFCFTLGSFGGWLDDISDIKEDFYHSKWSNVFIEVYQRCSGFVPYAGEFPFMLQHFLADRSIQQHVVAQGVRAFQQLQETVRSLPLQNQTIFENIAFSIYTFLGTAENLVAAQQEPALYEATAN